MPTRFAKFLPIIIISLLGLIIYSNTFNGPFLYDDEQYIVNNSNIKQLGDVERIWKALSHPVRFVAFYTFAVNYHFSQLDTVGYHVVNWLIHILTTILVWWFLTLLFETPRLKKESIALHGKLIALFGALIFLTHPIQTQAVSYISQRFASLATLFYMASMCLYVKGRLVKERIVLFFLGCALTAVLGMFTKEIVITLPIAIIFFEGYFLSKLSLKSFIENKKNWVFVGVALGFILIIPIVYEFSILSIIFNTEKIRSGSHEGDIITTGKYFLTQFPVIATYIKLLFVPIGLNLLHDFPLSETLFDGKTFLSFLLICSLLFLSFKLRKKAPLISFGILWYFLCLSVESSIIPIQHVIFEHRNYLPMLGFSLIVSTACFSLIKKREAVIVVLSSVIVMLSILTYQRNTVWTSSVALWSDVMAKAPNDQRAHNNLGLAYFREGRVDEALELFNKALKRFPRNAFVHNNRGYLYLQKNQLDLALVDFKKATQYKKWFDEAHNNLGLAYKQLGQDDLALVEYNKAIKYNKGYPQAYSNRGVIYDRKKQYDLALEDFNKAIELSPYYPEVYNNRGNVYRALKKYDLAMIDFNKVIELSPFFSKGYNNRATIHFSVGNYQKALNDLTIAIKINPKYTAAYYNRGNVYVKAKQMEAAVQEYTKALAIEPNYRDAYFNRGTAFVYLKRYIQALDDYNKVIEITPSFGAAYLQRSYVHRGLENYEAALSDALQAKAKGMPIQDEYLESLRK